MIDENNQRYTEPKHPYKIVRFTELCAVIVGPDNRCTCTIESYCPLGRKDCEDRCTLNELERLDSEAISRRAYQSGND